MFKNPFSFNGRIRRTEYGLSYGLYLLGIYGLAYIVESLEMNGLPIVVHFIALYWFLFSQGSKRCHDMGKSGFYQLIPFYMFAMIFAPGRNRRNQYGQDPKLVELEERNTIPSHQDKKLLLPEGKTWETIGSELLSGVLLTVLTVALISYFYSKVGWFYYIIECVVIMMGYYMVLLFGVRPEKSTDLNNYFLLHRLVFSVSTYICIWSYDVYSNNITDIDFSRIGGDFSYILAIFILTYIPFLVFKSKKTSQPIPLEA